MKLKLRRSQKSGLTGNITFKMLAIVDLDSNETEAVKKYKLGKEIVYVSPKAANHILTVNDLVNGKEISCKDINEMISAEEQIREACLGLSRILFVCEHFDGEEVIDIEPFQIEV